LNVEEQVFGDAACNGKAGQTEVFSMESLKPAEEK